MKTDSNRRDFLTTTLVLAGASTVGQLGFVREVAAKENSITQLASFRINPEKEAEALAFLKELTAAVEAKEPGVLAYIAHRSSSDPNLLTFFENYADEAAVANHGKQPHLAGMGKAFRDGVFRPFAEGRAVKVERLDRVSGFSR